MVLENCNLKDFYKIEWGGVRPVFEEHRRNFENRKLYWKLETRISYQRCGSHCSGDRFVYLKAEQCPVTWRTLTEHSRKIFMVRVIAGYKGLACAGSTSFVARKLCGASYVSVPQLDDGRVLAQDCSAESQSVCLLSWGGISFSWDLQ